MSAFFNPMEGHTNLLDSYNLEANRRGEITETQKQRLNASFNWVQGLAVLIVILFFGGTVCFISSIPVLAGEELESGSLLVLLVVGGVFLFVSLFGGRNLWGMLDTAIKLRRDQANRVIRQAQGQLSYHKKGYIFQVDERKLTLPPQGTGGLLPAVTYRVYYLEESGILLSAEEVFPAGLAQVRAALDEILAGANGFSLEDLAANRNGEATAAQRRKVLGRVIAGLVMIVMALGFSVIVIFGTLDGVQGEPIFVLMFGAFLVIFLLAGIALLAKALLDLFISAPQQAQGVGRKEKRVSGGKHRTTRYYYLVGGESFEIGSRAYTALIDGLEYRVYYLPHTKSLIAIETLSTSPGSPAF